VRIGEQNATGDDSLARTLPGMVTVTTLTLTAAGTPFQILGYGEPPRVFDYKNVVGRLLESDLAALEEATRRTPRYPPWSSPRLDAALADFLASEANRRIGGRLNEPPDALNRYAAETLRQAVSPDSAGRAVLVLRGAVERVHRTGMPLAVPALLLLPTALLVPAVLRGIIRFGPGPALAVGLATYGAARFLEWLARWRVRRRFGSALGPALPALLDDPSLAQKARKWYRRSAITGGLFGWIGGALIIAVLFLRAHPPRHRVPFRPAALYHAPAHHPTTRPRSHRAAARGGHR
jgi:hypothetical protein